jgi:putative addiction module component (TIGR02574 family)
VKLADFPTITSLSTLEKLELVDEIWTSFSADTDTLEVTEEEKRILQKRWAAFEQDSSSALTLDQFKAKLAARHK